MGNFGKVKDIKDLPPNKAILDFIKQAKKLNDDGIKVPKKTTILKPVVVPAYFKKALQGNKKALATFEAFSPSHKKEYVEWIVEAKTETTRDKRMAEALKWMSEGKARNWKYMKK